VVDVLDRPLDLDPRHLQLLELHQRHRAGGVLEQRLVDRQRDRLTRVELTVHQVLAQDLAGQVLGHLPQATQRGHRIAACHGVVR
jgi:hypothetical protein